VRPAPKSPAQPPAPSRSTPAATVEGSNHCRPRVLSPAPFLPVAMSPRAPWFCTCNVARFPYSALYLCIARPCSLHCSFTRAAIPATLFPALPAIMLSAGHHRYRTKPVMASIVLASLQGRRWSDSCAPGACTTAAPYGETNLGILGLDGFGRFC
jgi:hypothetical protein